jgi:protein-disulfide isomerase
MTNIRHFARRAAVTAVVLSITSIAAAQKAADPQSDQAAMEKIVQQYILDHGEIVAQALNQYQLRQQAESKQKTQKAIVDHINELAGDKSSPAKESAQAGPAVTIVEFFDYNCHFCKQVEPVLNRVLAENPGVRLVYKEFPILGETSELATRAALAARKQGAYDRVHDRLMMSDQKITMALIENLAAQLSLDFARLKADMDSKEISAMIAHNQELAATLGIGGTPALIVGSQFAQGGLDAKGFQALIDKAKAPVQNGTSAKGGI